MHLNLSTLFNPSTYQSKENQQSIIFLKSLPLFSQSEYKVIKDEKKRTCEHCGEKILGRSDKRFCSDYCRNSQHNLENRDNSNYMRKVNNVLRKNRRILAKYNPNGKAKIQGTALMEEGFNFAYFTNVYETKKGGKYFFCYDQGYIQIEDGYYALVVRESYVR